MKTWKSFVKRNIEWMILSAVLFFLHVLYLFLIGRTGDDLIYAGILDLCIIAAAVCMAYIRYYRKVRYLKGILQQPFSGELKLPETEDLTEELLGQLAENANIERQLAVSAAARQQSEMKDYYAKWVHQIKTPIAAMLILLQSVEDENPALPELKEMKMELFKMEQYVEMVLTYLRMEDMSGDLQFEKVSLDKILKQSVRKYSQMFILQKIRLDYRPVERIVLTDEKWLEFVTEQILSNALKYTKNGGEIRICLEEKRGRECLVIEDNGIGIQAEDLPRVFEKGFTGYNGRADKKSTGIGLYLCKKIMDKMGHKIWIDSEVGKGTRVYLELTRKEWNPE